MDIEKNIEKDIIVGNTQFTEMLKNTILDSFNKDDTNGCIAQLQNYIYSIKEYFSNLKNKYIEQFSDSIDDVMDSTGKNPNLSHCVERINSWCYYFDSVYNNYQKLLEIQ